MLLSLDNWKPIAQELGENEEFNLSDMTRKSIGLQKDENNMQNSVHCYISCDQTMNRLEVFCC